jgi:hypothetical protein
MVPKTRLTFSIAISLFVLCRDIVKVGVSIILGTPWVAYEKLKAGISREPSDERPVDNSRLCWVG